MKAQATASQGKATTESRTLSVRIEKPFARVYEFLVAPANWNKWAFGLGKPLRRSKGGWIADSDGGMLKVRFTARNQYGVLDHSVIRPSGAQVYVRMRLIVNGSGCELLFTLFREPGVTDEHYNADADSVQRDLNGLKELLEK
ncbi:MAG: SRPBCC family protein [Chloracidobacterium sp.]|nr:SRPBCC family protein [Chloracidobacterium sp.]